MSAKNDTASDDATLASLIEQTAAQAAASELCPRCGQLNPSMNHVTGERYEDCGRCHRNGRLFDKGCRSKSCQRCTRVIDSGYREGGLF